MKYQSWFRCIHCDDERYPLNEIIYECRKCGGLLEVSHDMEAIRENSGGKWMRLFDERYMRGEFPFGSSVWGKKEIVCPMVEDDNVVSMYEGGSNLFWAERLGAELGVNELWVKQCGNSHTGSFKDLGMTVLVSMVKQMIADGKPIRAVACASTGDTSAALSAYGAAAGIPVVVFLPKTDKISIPQLIQPISNGALTVSLDSDFDGAMEVVRKLCQSETIYLANSMNSLRIEGQKTVAIELVQQKDWTVPDWVIIPGGNLGNVSALGKGFLEMREMGMIDRLPRLAVAQAAHANPLYRSYLQDFKDFEPQSATRTLASAIQIGNPVSREKAIRTLRAFDGVVGDATEDELANACARADRTGLFTCPHTGVALAVLDKLLANGKIEKSDVVLVISTAHGLKFPDFKMNYHNDNLADLSVAPAYRNELLEVPADYDQVRSVVLRELERGTSANG